MNQVANKTASITLSTGETKIIPTSWDQVTIEKYVQYLEQVEQTALQEKGIDFFEVLLFFTDTEESDWSELQYQDVQAACQCLHFVAEPLIDFKKFQEDFDSSSLFIISGERYNFPTSLPELPFQNQTFGDFTDSMDYWKQGEDLLKGKLSILPQMMAILLKKEGDKTPLSIDKRTAWIEERAAFWKAQSMWHGWQFLFFFLKMLKPFKATTPQFSEEAKESQGEQRRNEQHN